MTKNILFNGRVRVQRTRNKNEPLFKAEKIKYLKQD